MLVKIMLSDPLQQRELLPLTCAETVIHDTDDGRTPGDPMA
jgi:hypothetical protein